MVATRFKIIWLLFLLASLACVRAKLPDLAKICAADEACDTSVKTVGSTFSNFKVASECVNCLDANIGDDNATISCKVSGCYNDGKDYEFARFSKTNPMRNILDKAICADPTTKNIEKLTVGCTIEHESRDPVEINTSKLKASPSFLLENERLCMNLYFVKRKLVDQHKPDNIYDSHVITIEPRLRPNCNTDNDADKMVILEFSR